MPSEWIEWHKGYEEGKPLAERLRVVRSLISDALDEYRPGPIQVISMCAGDGRDLLGVIATHRRGTDVRARLVELDGELVASGMERASRDRIGEIEFVAVDASVTDAYVGAVPADLILICGVFGNIVDDDVFRTIEHLPELSAERARVIWTRGRFEPDLTPAIRRRFTDGGFSEVAFIPIAGTTMSVGVHQLASPPRPMRASMRLFTFLPREQRPSMVASHSTG